MLKKNDFIELDFIASVKGTSQVFDTTLLEEAKKANLLNQSEEEKEEEKKFKPLRLCIGQGMIVPGLDKALEGKEIGKWYDAEFEPKDAFGLRNPKLVKIFPLLAFRERGINPEAGMMLTLDNMLVRISAVSGGRVIVDFNSPLAGKAVIYRFRINSQIKDDKEKLEITAGFFLGKLENIEFKEDKKAVLEFKVNFPEKIKDEFAKKVKDILDIDIEFKEAKEDKKSVKDKKV